MQTKYAFTAGLGASVRLSPVIDPACESGATAQTQEKATGALQGTSAAIENEHLDFASLAQSAPAIPHPLKARLVLWASWLATVFQGVA